MPRDSNVVLGMMCWEGSASLAEVVCSAPRMFADCVIVELGAGCVPLPSLAACSARAKTCWVTDGNDEVLQLAQKNVECNRERMQSMTDVRFRKLVWGNAVDTKAFLSECQELNWIFGADVVYAEEGTKALFQTVSVLLESFPKAKLLLSYVVRGVSESRIVEMAKESGLMKIALPPEINKMTKHATHLGLFMKRQERCSVKCMKCNVSLARVVVRQRHPLCPACLFDNVESKFRSQFKTKAAIQPGDRVLLEGSGSVESQSLLNLLLQYRHPDATTVRRGKTYFTLEVLHIQDPTQVNGTMEVVESIQEILARHEDSAAGVTVQTLELKPVDWSSVCPEVDAITLFDLQRIYKRQFLLKHAQSCSFNVVVSLETSTSLAQGILSSACKGGGFGVASSLDLFDRRFSKTMGLTLIRLLKELSIVELAFYCHFKKLKSTASLLPATDSVDSLAEQFIHSLHETFPSGVSSMLSMGSKLKSVDWSSTPLCPICSEPLPDDTYCYSCRMRILSKLDSDRIAHLINELNN